MSLINKEVSDFTAKAYHDNGFITVTKEDLLGKWSVFFFILLISPLCARQN